MFTNFMKIRLHITPARCISDIQKEFTTEFPFLKIEFFNNKSSSRSAFSANQLIPNSRTVGNSRLTCAEGDIEIDEEVKVNELEKIFKDRFNLAVQVFRKSGNLWLETTMTDNWTLQQQNTHGREISTGKKKDTKADEYDLNRDADH